MKNTNTFTFIQRAQGTLCAVMLGLLPCVTIHKLSAQDETDIAPKIMFDKSLLTSEGNLTEESLPKFLAEAYREKKLKDDAFSKEACLKAKNIATEGGLQTLQLFLVTSTCHPKEASMYIIKEPSSGKIEAINLKEIEKFPGMKELIAPNVVKGLPSIALPFANFSYANGKTHYIAAMPAAKGKILANFITEFRVNQSPQNRERMSRAYRILGREISAFHKRFMKPVEGRILGNTVVHGDFHIFNIFYDEISGHFTLIDNESMAYSLHDLANPSVDLKQLFFVPFTLNFPKFRDVIKGIDVKTWCSIALKDFLLGYLEPYKPTEHKQLLEEIKPMFDSFSDWAQFDPQELKILKEQGIKPVFDELINRK